MKKIVNFILLLILVFSSTAQPLQRPRLVVGIVIDQMRWDYLYRYYDRYSENGFKKLLKEGFSCENAMIPYAPTVTACGHSSIYTGSVPAITGITGNFWWDNQLNKNVYCTEDSSAKTIGSNTTAGMQSPKNLLTTTIGDELRLATNFKSKVTGIALKDRASILPAGHSPSSAYWFDAAAGVWITSSYYTKQLPEWVKNFQSKKMIDTYYNEGWKTMYPLNTYTQSTPDENEYEAKPFGSAARGFPYNFSSSAGKNYNTVLATPFGNTLTAAFAKQVIINEELGKDSVTDLLAISFSSPDYVGHAFGPNSVEEEDLYLRLDKELGDLLMFLDDKVGNDQYTLFLSADHGVAHVPAFANDHNIPAGGVDFTVLFNKLNAGLKEKFGQNDIIADLENYQLSLNLPLIASASLNITDIKKWIINYLSNEPGIQRVIDMDNLNIVPLNSNIKSMLANGYYPGRCGEIQLILQPQWIEGFPNGGTTHGVWNPYDAHIPLLWYGWGIKHGVTNREVYMTDIASTLAALLHIQMPSGCVGNVITEVFK
jgi:predicted AlkP superfamily pyrophosphatase or phosphodiesterase